MNQKATDYSVAHPYSRRDLLRNAVAGLVASAASAGSSADAGAATVSKGACGQAVVGIRAYKLYTGPDHASHVLVGTVVEAVRSEVISVQFKETPAHSSEDWHDSPEAQYVITLSGTLEFTTRAGETFVLRAGDVLLSEDDIGSGHRWRLIDDQPWRRAYVDRPRRLKAYGVLR